MGVGRCCLCAVAAVNSAVTDRCISTFRAGSSGRIEDAPAASLGKAGGEEEWSGNWTFPTAWQLASVGLVGQEEVVWRIVGALWRYCENSKAGVEELRGFTPEKAQ